MQRLIVDSLELHNFKSYYGTHTLGPFHSSFSVVIGPNGSGKSNVIDALLFCFGFRSQKLRLPSLVELIHNSASGRELNGGDIDMAYVTANFSLYDDATGTREAVFSVKRQINASYNANKEKRTATSSYYLSEPNKREQTASAKDVIAKLKEYKIDLDKNRFLILQGEVEQISLMKPKKQTPTSPEGFLEYLESIIGTDVYVSMIEQAEQHITEVAEERDGLVKRLQIAEANRAELDGERDAAAEHLMLQKDLEAAQLELYSTQRGRCEKNVADLADRAEAAKVAHEEAKAAVKEAEAEHAAIIAQHREKKAMEGRLSMAVEGAQEALDEATKARSTASATASRAEKTASRAQKSRGSAEKEADSLKTEAMLLGQREAHMAKDAEEVEAELKRASEALSAVVEETSGEVAGAASARVKEAEKELNAEVKTLSALQATRARLSKQISAATGSDTRTAALRRAQTAVARMTGEATKLRASRVDLEGRLSSMGSRSPADIQAEFDRMLVEQRRANQRERGSNRAKAVEKLAQKLIDDSRLHNGVLGRLGSLLEIDGRYDTAVSSSGNFDVIIVDRIKTAKTAMNLLRDERLGQASFVALDTLEPIYGKNLDAMKAAGPFDTPDTHRLFDLIDIIPELQGAGDSLLRRLELAVFMAVKGTVVVPDLRAAKVLSSKGSFRIVTLRGELSETSGSLTGGGVAASGALRIRGETSTVPAAEIARRIDELKLERQEAARDAEARRTLSESLSGLARRLERTEAELATAAEAVSRIEAELAQGESPEIAQARAEAEAVAEQIAAQQETVAACNAALTEANDAVLSDTDRARLKSAKVVVARRDAAAKAMRSELADIRTKLENAKKRMEKAEERAAAASVTFEEATRTAEAERAKLGSLQTAVSAATKAFDAAQEELVDFQSEAADLFKQMTNLTKRREEVCIAAREADAEARKAARLAEDQRVRLDNYKKLEAKAEKALGELAQVLEKLGLADVEEQQRASEEVQYDDDEEEEGDDEDNEEADDQDEDEDVDMQPSASRQVRLLEARIDTLKTRLREGGVNMAIVEQWIEKNNEFLQRAAAVEANTADLAAARKQHESLRKERIEKFTAGTAEISGHLQVIYRMLTMGGNAELEIIDALDPFTEGVSLSVLPPRKSWKRIGNLSGGERTLSSLALIFALHCYRPTPIYVMDEIDAALDFKNVSIVAEYVKSKTENAQFLTISLRSNMFELADRLIGIYKINDQTKSIAIDPAKVAQLAQ
ncbi:Structural maintenance of chromosomes protein 4, SMC4 [Carpediemonas membranifera]|uniref:Structural maintenance of chromosomes protein n=1 Tax=Carpediemonas membranifera TaxID=201153 RepID=A0A8J6E1X3_9EUKA|nr:Structural maintenance of chromosomes protein 4, SMC4 [Carpediemonas membranifera]|eukprot:KAG9393596.1 Structural maintenance of chromosomes protein 4, SMC4 [Carpediemonas membranifera]